MDWKSGQLPSGTGTRQRPSAAGHNPSSPLYTQVKHGLAEAIRSGRWRAHDRLPSEHELLRQYRVSRMTVNRALRELAQEGWVKRVQGVGTFVADTRGQSSPVTVRDIAEEIEARGHCHATRVLELGQRSADAAAAEALRLRHGTPVYYSLLVHLDDGLPVQLEERFVRPAAAPDYLAQDFTRITPHAYLMAAAPLSEAEHVIEAVTAGSRETRLLELAAPEACLLLHRWTWSGAHMVSFAHLLFPGSRYRLGEHFTARDSGG